MKELKKKSSLMLPRRRKKRKKKRNSLSKNTWLKRRELTLRLKPESTKK